MLHSRKVCFNGHKAHQPFGSDLRAHTHTLSLFHTHRGSIESTIFRQENSSAADSGGMPRKDGKMKVLWNARIKEVGICLCHVQNIRLESLKGWFGTSRRLQGTQTCFSLNLIFTHLFVHLRWSFCASAASPAALTSAMCAIVKKHEE